MKANIGSIESWEGIGEEVYLVGVRGYFVSEIIKKEDGEGIVVGFGGERGVKWGREV